MPEYLYSNKCTNANISYITYDAISYENQEDGTLQRGLDGAPIRRTLKLVNRLISFSYALPSKYINRANKLIGTVNKNTVCIGGLTFPANTVKLIALSPESIKSKEGTAFTGVDVTFEIGDQRDVYRTEATIEGFFFRHPVNGNMVRIQYSSEPDIYLKDKSLYPNAVNVWRGFGFYTESRPDLNIPEPFPLTVDGSLNIGDIVYKQVVADTKTDNWSILAIPKEGLV